MSNKNEDVFENGFNKINSLLGDDSQESNENLTQSRMDYPDLSLVVFEDKTVVYNKLPHTIEATNLPPDVLVNYSHTPNNSVPMESAGVYEITAEFMYDTGNMPELIETRTATLTIEKLPNNGVDMIVFESKTITYDGNLHALEATNLPEFVIVNYTQNNSQKYVGSYEITATFYEDLGTGSPEIIGEKTANLIITELPKPDISGVIFGDFVKEYDGSDVTITALNVPENVYVEYAPTNVFTEIGVYQMTGKFTANIGNESPYLLLDKTVSVVVHPSIDDVVFDSKTVEWDDNSHTIDATNLPENIEVVYDPIDKDYTDIGAHDIRATFSYLGEVFDTKTATLTITKKTPSNLDDVIYVDKTETFVGYPVDKGYTIMPENLPVGVTYVSDPINLINAGEHTFTATFYEDLGTGTPEEIGTKTAILTILPATPPSLEDVVFMDSSYVFDDTFKTIVATNLPENVAVEYSTNNSQKMVGEYIITASFLTKLSTTTPEIFDTKTATLTITKKQPTDLSGVTFIEKVVEYNSLEQAIVAENYPEDMTVIYTPTNKFIVVGRHEVTANFYEDLGTGTAEIIESLTADLVITPPIDDVVFIDKSMFWDGNIHVTYASNLPIGVTAIYTPNPPSSSSVGVHVFKAEFEFEGIIIGEKEATINITKLPIPPLDDVVFNSKTVEHNGQEQSIVATNLPPMVTVEYTPNNKFTDIGVHEITATFSTNMGEGVEEIGTKSATLTIEQEFVPTLDDVVFNDKTVKYNGKLHVIVATNLPENVTVSYRPSNKYSNIGIHEVTAIFVYETKEIGTLTANLIIEKMDAPSLDGVIFIDKIVTFDGNAQTIEATDIPEGVTVEYDPNNTQTVVGEYEITATFSADLGTGTPEEIGTKTAKLTINKMTAPDVSGITLEDEIVEFDDTNHMINVTGVLPSGVTVTYTPIDGTKAIGIHPYTAQLKADLGTGTPENIGTLLTADLTIYPALTGVKFDDETVTWDDQEHTILATDLPTDITAIYTPATGFKEVGVHDISAKFMYKNTVETGQTKEAKLTIEKMAIPSLDAVVFDSKSFEFDGSEHSIEATNLPSGVTVTYVPNNTFSAVGVYEITATFNANLGTGDEIIGTKTATLTITDKPIPSLDEVVFDSKTVTYDGNMHTIDATNLPENVTVIYDPAVKEFSEVGVYQITAKFMFDGDEIGTKTATLTINSDTPSGDMTEIITLLKLEYYFNWISIGSVFAGLSDEEITMDIFKEFMELYLPLELLYNINHYRLVEIYHEVMDGTYVN